VFAAYDVLKHDLFWLSKDAVMRLSHSLIQKKRGSADVETIAPRQSGEKGSGAKGGTKKPAAARKQKRSRQRKRKG